VGINAKAVVRVIIEGEWIWVERGTFTVMPLEFEDDNGNAVSVTADPMPAYFFVSTNGDPYFGPLQSISLFKLDTQIMEETGSGPPARGRPFELPEGSGETVGGEVGPRRTDEPSDADAADEPAEPDKKTVPLFAEDVEEEDEAEDALFSGERRRGGGLF
jgi:hypothetical protein